MLSAAIPFLQIFTFLFCSTFFLSRGWHVFLFFKKSNRKKMKRSITNDSTGGLLSSEETKNFTSLKELFEHELREMLWAERTITLAIPKMIEHASSQELRDALDDHLDITEEHSMRIEQVFKILGKEIKGEKNDSVQILALETEQVMEHTKGSVCDAAIVLAAQRIEHYEIASYGTLCTFANVLGLKDAEELLCATLDEEKDADKKLTAISSEINSKALIANVVEKAEQVEESGK
jgi:ferritin-like metal-binding protein YciE